MRALREDEKNRLVNAGCRAQSWDTIQVTDDFYPDGYENVTFAGEVLLARQDARIGFKVKNVRLENCEIGQNVKIEDVAEGINGYCIERGCTLRHIGRMVYDEKELCGEGTEIAPLDETGSRSLLLHRGLTAQIAYLTVFARHNPSVSTQLSSIAEQYVAEHKLGKQARIASGTVIEFAGTLVNVHIPEASTLSGVKRIERATLCHASIGDNVIMADVVAMPGSVITESCMLHRCFVGEGVRMDGAFSAHDTLIFANSHLSNGEASAALLGPHTVSMHRSTLLIGSSVSFFNAGSGTNQSNHHYRLGPMHYGVMGRGCKTASNAYLLWPAVIGSFTKVVGRVMTQPDTRHFPFSELIAEGNNTKLRPAALLASIGTLRDQDKWYWRDKRVHKESGDLIDYSAVPPSVVSEMYAGYNELRLLLEQRPEIERYNVRGAAIERADLLSGIDRYRGALVLFVANTLAQWCLDRTAALKALHANARQKQDALVYYDLFGISVSEADLTRLYKQLERKKVRNVDQLAEFFRQCDNRNRFLIPLATALLAQLFDGTTEQRLTACLTEALKVSERTEKEVLRDAAKEQSSRVQVAYGLLASDSGAAARELSLLKGNTDELPFIKQMRAQREEERCAMERLLS